MGDFVIDTNVWVMADKPISEATLTELDCIACCKAWLSNFRNDRRSRLVLDHCYTILREYRRNMTEGGFARQILNELETQPRDRLIELEIELDDDGFALLPLELDGFDKDDRKFVAVAIAHNPLPPIVNASDTD